MQEQIMGTLYYIFNILYKKNKNFKSQILLRGKKKIILTLKNVNYWFLIYNKN